jgi:hypothetical protein
VHQFQNLPPAAQTHPSSKQVLSTLRGTCDRWIFTIHSHSDQYKTCLSLHCENLWTRGSDMAVFDDAKGCKRYNTDPHPSRVRRSRVRVRVHLERTRGSPALFLGCRPLSHSPPKHAWSPPSRIGKCSSATIRLNTPVDLNIQPKPIGACMGHHYQTRVLMPDFSETWKACSTRRYRRYQIPNSAVIRKSRWVAIR